MNRRLVAGFAMLAAIGALCVAPVVAQASSPEVGRCVKKAVAEGVGYSTATCTTGGTGVNAKYEWQAGPPAKPRFTSSEGVTFIEGAVSKAKITCKAALDSGELTGAKTDQEQMIWTGCEINGIKCSSAGQPEGTIVTATLKSVLGYINKEKKQVGVSLEGLGSPVFAEFNCGSSLPVVIRGSVIAKVTPVSKMATTFTELFTETKGHQKPEKFEGEPKDTLECQVAGGPFEQCGFVSKDVVKTEESVEIRALSEPKWWVAGSLLVGSEALAEETTVTQPFKLILTQEKGLVEIGTVECTEVKLKGAQIEAPSSRSEKAVEYGGCKVLKPASTEENPNCEVLGREITTNELSATLEGAVGAEKLRFGPKVGKELGGFEIIGASCSFKGKFRANGVMICGYEEVEIEKLEHPLAFTGTSGSNVTLEGPGGVGTRPQTGLTVTYADHLASGKLYSAF
jgi:hypothetical protein